MATAIATTSCVKTRFLIMSDSHGEELLSNTKIPEPVNIVIHCGDLTEESKIEEFRRTLHYLRNISAELKLVIAGNHDFTMDVPIFRKKVADVQPALDPHLVCKEYGNYGEVRQLFEEAKSAGIIFLDEGTHIFNLQNGALLKVYASPFTPSLSGDWGFQYYPNQGHEFLIPKDIDVVITHGPPKGIMDYTEAHQRAGCPRLFEAVTRARPRLHCFGHIHEGWGAKLVAWRNKISENPSHFTDIDNSRSVVIGNIARLKESYKDDRPPWLSSSHCSEDSKPLEPGKHTLFVNAAIQGITDLNQIPWLIDIELPRNASI
jgi:Icc-related predicted phosphoesterase